MPENSLTHKIDALLPQTQCRLCGYNGCKPYAAAMAKGETPISKCQPGGVETLHALGDLLGIDPAPYEAEVKAQTKSAQIVVIREDECIGCMKCIRACPVDAIIGAAKQMHVVIASDCTGCELCIRPCPVDCIDIISIAEPSEPQKQMNAERWRARYEARTERLARIKQQEKEKHLEQKKNSDSRQETIENRRKFIAEAIERTQKK